MSDQTIAAAALYDALGRGASHDVETIAEALTKAERRGMLRAAHIVSHSAPAASVIILVEAGDRAD